MSAVFKNLRQVTISFITFSILALGCGLAINLSSNGTSEIFDSSFLLKVHGVLNSKIRNSVIFFLCGSMTIVAASMGFCVLMFKNKLFFSIYGVVLCFTGIILMTIGSIYSATD